MKWKNRRAPSPAPSGSRRDGPYDLIRVLSDELAHIGKLRAKSNSAFVQRLFVRQFGSSLDAYAFYFQDRARESAESEGVQFTDAELAALHMRPDDTDQDRLRPAFQRTTKNMMFAIEVFAKARKTIPPCRELPSAIDAAVRIRNRLTHPKKASDFELTAAELKIVAVSIQWLQQIASWGSHEEAAYIERVKQRIHDSIEKQRQAMRERVNPQEGVSKE
ncbi:MAG TPA: hypothetical protein VGJ82_10845 [Thermoanaerobaculia bacterium]|jgi:hypothetical protein